MFRSGESLKIKVVVHEAEEGGFWAEAPAIPGCATQGETFEELLTDLYEAVEGCLSVDVAEPTPGGQGTCSRNRGMKALSGRDFARLVERHGYVCSASAAVITSTASPEAWSVYRSRFTEASR